MSTLLNELKLKSVETLTANGDITYTSTFNANLDLFASASSLRGASEERIASLFNKAALENKSLAFMNLFNLRDIRTGNGERRAFKVALKELSRVLPNEVASIVPFVPEYGRWDDLWVLLGEDVVHNVVVELVKHQLSLDLKALEENGTVSLLAKWMPSINTSSQTTRRYGRVLANELFDGNEVAYRKTLVKLRKKLDLVENYMRTKSYTFDYLKLPGKALSMYTPAFMRNDIERYRAFLESLKSEDNVKKLESKASILYPYEIYAKIHPMYDWRNSLASSREDIDLANALWSALPNVEMKGKTLFVLDTSGSMETSIPNTTKYKVAQAANALAIYGAERLTGEFKNKIVTFSSKPQFITLPEGSLEDKVNHLREYSIIDSTNIEAVYNLIFEASKRANKEDYLDNIVFLSDMEFNAGTMGGHRPTQSTFDTLKEKFEAEGIPLPKLVYWNLNVSRTIFPTTDLENATFVSGFSSAMFNEFSEGVIPSALELMFKTLDKYSFVMEVLPR